MSAIVTFAAIAAILIAVTFGYPMLRLWLSEGMKPGECLHNMGVRNILIFVAVLVASAAIFTAILEVGV